MSTLDSPGTGGNPSPHSRVLPVPPRTHPSTRKAPPSPLAISSTSLSPRSKTRIPHTKISSSSSTPNTRNSLESSRSSVRSDVTSLHCSEFPTPPSALPPIPASPQTPKSLNYSATTPTTPTTPRSRSPHSGFLPLQDPSRGSARALLGSTKSLKEFFSSSRSPGSTSQFAAQQDQPAREPRPNNPRTSRSLEDLKHDSIRSGESVPARYSQYVVYKGSKQSTSRPVTPTIARTPTHQDSSPSDGRTSPLQPPRPAYIRDETSTRPHSPSRNGSSFAMQQEQTTHSTTRAQSPAPQSPRSMSPQPPRSPLPVLPTKRDSPWESARYSHIARKAGITDMGTDISEEQLLSTHFITEMLTQPVTASPRSAPFLRLPDSPRSLASSDDSHGLGRHIRRSEMHLSPGSNLALDSPGFAPTSVSMNEAAQLSDDAPSPRTPEPGSALPTGVEGGDYKPSDSRMQSGIASSVFPKGGDKVYFDEPSPLLVSSLHASTNFQSLAVPAHAEGHGSPHPLVPSTPISAQSFTEATSPPTSHDFAQAQAKHLSVWRKSSTSQSIAIRLPIGPSSGIPSAAAMGGQKVTLPRGGPPKVRQHHYPRHGLTKPVTQTDQTAITSVLQDAAVTSGPSSPSLASNEQEQETTAEEKSDPSVQADTYELSASKSNVLSVSSHTSSTRTQRDSLTPSLTLGSSRQVAQSIPPSSRSQAHLRHSHESHVLSSDSPRDDEESSYDIEGEVHIASRVLDTTAPLITRVGDATRPTIVGMATAVVVRSKSLDRCATDETGQHYQSLDVSGSTPGFEPETSVPPSPRYPPSIDSPPSHRTDTPESAKSIYFSEDVHNARHRSYLPYDEVAGQGFTFWDIHQNASHVELATAPTDRRFSNNAGSFKSVISYITARSRASTVTSKVTKGSHRSNQSTASSRWAWLKKKALPPLPPPSPTQLESVSTDHGELQLPIYTERTVGSSPILDPGQYRKSNVSLVGQGEPQGWSDTNHEKWTSRLADDESDTHGSTYLGSLGKVEILGVDSLKVARRKSSRRRDTQKQNEASMYGPRDLSNVRDVQPAHLILNPLRVRTRTGKRLCFSLIGVVTLALILGVALGLTLGHKHSNVSSSCSGNKAGVQCNLDATCTCPSSSSSTCAAPLAHALNSLVPVTSQLFTTNITSQRMALVLWESQGTPTTPNCVFQADLVDVGSVLDPNLSPNRTQWAQAALLWNLFQTGDIDASQSLRTTVTKLPFASLHSKDGIESDPSGVFSVTLSGYTYNFANQTVSAPSLTFKLDGSPSSDQISKLNSVVEGSLDRMYSFASASSTQRQAALSTYWRSVLSLSSNDLPAFLTAFKTAPILLPFDATSSPGGNAMSDMLTEAVNRTLSFPPAIGCYPGLSSSQVQRISTVETQVFGLPALNSTSSTFDSSCFANHPVYGVLDVLRTRLPFSDARNGVAKQAAVLTSDAASRVVLHVGEQLSALPAPNDTDLTQFDVDPREFGTVSHLNHIALAWLQSFPTTLLATEAAKFVLSSLSSSAPPPSSSGLFNITSLPTVEVAIFGNIFLSDCSSFLSSLAAPSGSLFFGSSEAQAFRRWALQQSSSATIAWSQSAFAPQTVHEGSSTNVLFEQIWSAAGSLLAGPTNSSSVQAVMDALNNGGFVGS